MDYSKDLLRIINNYKNYYSKNNINYEIKDKEQKPSTNNNTNNNTNNTSNTNNNKPNTNYDDLYNGLISINSVDKEKVNEKQKLSNSNSLQRFLNNLKEAISHNSDITIPTSTVTPTPTVAPTPTINPTPTATVAPTVEPTPTVNPTPTATVAPTVEPTPTVNPTPTATVAPTVEPTPTVNPTPTATVAPTVEPTVEPTPTATITPTPTPTPTVEIAPTLGDDGKYRQNGELYTGTLLDGKYCENGVLFSGTKEGKLYENGVLFNGTKDGKVYDNGVLLNGTKDGKLYENGVLFNGTKNNKLYENGVLFNGTKDGKVYDSGVLFSGVKDGKLYENGILVDDVKDDILYENGVPFNGIKDGKLYENGVLFNGTKNNKLYENGVLFNGTKNNKLYENGVLFSGTKDGKVYDNGVLFNGTKDGKVYDSGVLLNGTKDGKLYENGVLFNGTKDGKVYDNGVLFSGTKDGKVYDSGVLLNGIKDGKLYENGVLFNGTKDGKVYDNGVLFSGTKDNKLYENGVLFNGTKNNKLYENGVLFNGTKDGKVYDNGVLFSGTKDGKLYEDGILFSGIKDGNLYINGEISTGGKEESPVETQYDSNNRLVSASKDFGGETVTLSRSEILSYMNEDTQYYFTSVDALDISDYIVKDALLLKYAETQALKVGTKGSQAYNDAYNATIKSQMIKSPSTMTNTVGEVVEQNNQLYVNNGSSLVKLNISAETYIDLFPPVDRYDINQGTIGDCYFISGCLIDMMKNPTAFSQLLQIFSEDSQGNISIKFAGTLKDYSPVTFEKGELKTIDGRVNGSYAKKYDLINGALGVRMLEQAYAIARFAKDSGQQVSTIDIDAAIPAIDFGKQSQVYGEVLNLRFENTPMIYKELIEAKKTTIDDCETKILNYLEHSIAWENTKNSVKDLSYVNDNIILFLGNSDLKHSNFKECNLTSANPDLEQFRSIVKDYYYRITGYQDICNLTDAQLKEIIKIAIDNNFYTNYINYINSTNTLVAKDNSLAYVNQGLRSYIRTHYYDPDEVDNNTERSRIINEIKQNGLYNLLLRDSKNLDTMADDINNHRMIFSVITYEGQEDESYDIVDQHAYSVEKIDTENDIVYINNPWYSGAHIAVPYSIFINCFGVGSYAYL